MVGRIQYAPTTGYVRSFEIPMQFPNRIRVVLRKTTPFSSPFGAAYGAYSIRPYKRVRAALQKTVLFSSPSGPSVGRMRYTPTAGYVRSFEVPMQFFNWVRAAFQKNVPFSSPSGPSVGRMQYAPTTGYVRFFEIPMRSSDRVRMALQKTILFSSPTGPSVGAYAIRPYNRVRAILRNTDAILQLGTCEGSKNGSVFATVGDVWWGVCDTPLRLDTCGPPKNCPVFVSFGAVCGVYAIHPYDRYVRPFKKLSRFRPLRGRLWGVLHTPLQSGTCGPSKNYPVFVSFGAVCGAYAIRPYNRVRAILRNTDAIPQPDTGYPMKYECASPTGDNCGLGRWGGGGYRLRGRWA